jgi:methyltransferase family protein
MLVTNFHLKYALYRIVLAGYQLLDTGRLHPVRERNIRSLASSVDYLDEHMADAIGFETQKELIDHALRLVSVDGHLLECGVFSGGTIRHIAKRVPGKTIHGFDSFEGLPEAWSGYNLVGKAFSLKGRLPRVPRNVVLHKGWFSNTIPAWCQTVGGPVAFLHIDCDIYSSTVDIFNGLAGRLQEGTLILFDEYFNYPGWQQHEFKAWQEFVKAQAVEYEYLGFARQQVLVRIRSLGGSQ